MRDEEPLTLDEEVEVDRRDAFGGNAQLRHRAERNRSRSDVEWREKSAEDSVAMEDLDSKAAVGHDEATNLATAPERCRAGFVPRASDAITRRFRRSRSRNPESYVS